MIFCVHTYTMHFYGIFMQLSPLICAYWERCNIFFFQLDVFIFVCTHENRKDVSLFFLACIVLWMSSHNEIKRRRNKKKMTKEEEKYIKEHRHIYCMLKHADSRKNGWWYSNFYAGNERNGNKPRICIWLCGLQLIASLALSLSLTLFSLSFFLFVCVYFMIINAKWNKLLWISFHPPHLCHWILHFERARIVLEANTCKKIHQQKP